MTNYRKQPDSRPWAKQLDQGDQLTSEQAANVCGTRLRDFGLYLLETKAGWFVVTAD